ncbi:TIGR03086 family metal-binding protein [Micromonospora sp. NPDC047644]|uniref:TIGR03086 family metal-binding protein n=1 Tax=Micromonospora sp. NPDC047644 TaxID=3157203 RepID=UPI0034569176
MDLLEAYRRSLAEFIDRVDQIEPGQWSDPTPCSDWDLRTLVNHVVTEDRWSVPLLAGRTIDEVGDRLDGDQLGADPIATAREAAAQAEIAATHPGALDRTVHLSGGDTPATEYLRQLLAEHLVHGWDVAVAIGAAATVRPGRGARRRPVVRRRDRRLPAQQPGPHRRTGARRRRRAGPPAGRVRPRPRLGAERLSESRSTGATAAPDLAVTSGD